MKYIVTFTGEKFTPLDPDIHKIHIEDIAHALSLLCCGNGHIERFYSIAQHSINCANEAKVRGHCLRVQLACLIHDASEAYISDITRPVKYYLTEYKVIEKHLQDMIYTKFLGDVLNEEEQEHVDQIDDEILLCELDALMRVKETHYVIPKLMSTPSFETGSFIETESKFLKIYYGIMHAGLIQGR